MEFLGDPPQNAVREAVIHDMIIKETTAFGQPKTGCTVRWQGSRQAGHDGTERVADYSGTDFDGDYRH